jgi:hypothetical protein
MLGAITQEKTFPMVAAFAKAGGTVVTVGNSSRMVAALGVPVSNILAVKDKDGKEQEISATKFYIPGSILTTKTDIAHPLAYGVPETVNVFYNNSPVFSMPADPAIRKISWFYNDDPLVSGWAWGQKILNGNTIVLDAALGNGHVFLLGPEVTQRGQPYATFKYLFNAALYGPRAATHPTG